MRLFAGLLLAYTGTALAVGTSLETDSEKYSYAIGVNFAQSLLRQGVPIDADAVYMALQDSLSGGDLRLTADVMSDALRAEAQRAGERKRAMAGENLKRGKDFMAEQRQGRCDHTAQWDPVRSPAQRRW
jgi:hypothetical protein